MYTRPTTELVFGPVYVTAVTHSINRTHSCISKTKITCHVMPCTLRQELALGSNGHLCSGGPSRAAMARARVRTRARRPAQGARSRSAQAQRLSLPPPINRHTEWRRLFSTSCYRTWVRHRGRNGCSTNRCQTVRYVMARRSFVRPYRGGCTLQPSMSPPLSMSMMTLARRLLMILRAFAIQVRL